MVAFLALILLAVVMSAIFASAKSDLKNDVVRKDIVHKVGGTQDKLVASLSKQPAQNTSVCYASSGAKWSTLPITYTINPSNSGSLSEQFIIQLF